MLKYKGKLKILLMIIISISIIVIQKNIYSVSSSLQAVSSVETGKTFTVTIKANAASWNVQLSYNGPVKLVSSTTSFANATDSAKNENVTIGTVTFEATGEGTASFTLNRTISR